MLTVTLQQLHVPDLCKCQYHKKVFHCSTSKEVFASHKELAEKLEKWHKQQGSAACWVYSVVKVA